MDIDERKEIEEEFSFKNYFIPLTTAKAITWIIVIGFIVFCNSLFNGFVGDDKIYITNNLPTHIISLSNAFGPSIFNTQGQYRPIPSLYFSIQYVLFGANTFFYHFFQLLLHIGCSILLFILFRKFFSVTLTFFLVLIFLVHPLQVESVSYISQTVSELFFFSGMLAFLLSLKKKISVKTLITISLLLLFSFLTKETGVLFFLLILTYSLLFNRKYTLKFLCVGIMSLAIYIFLRYFVGHVDLDTKQLSPIAMLPLQERWISFPDIIFYYVKSFILPLYLAYDQQWVITSIDFIHFYLPLFADFLFFIAICGAGVFIQKKQKKNTRLFLFFCLWFASGIGLIMQVFALDATVADRWFYFPLAGLLGIIGIFIESGTWSKNSKKISVVVTVCIFVLLSLRTMVRNTNWSDGITLFSHDVKISDNPNLDGNLAYELLLDNRVSEGMYYLQKSVYAKPNASNLYDLGSYYEQAHDYQKALYYYSLSIEQKDRSYGENEAKEHAYQGMARTLTLHGNPKTAKEFLNNTIKIYPRDGSYWAFLSIVEYKSGDQNEALIAAKQAKILLHNSSANILYDRISNKKPLNLKVE
jgi:protein O-mannosyl-transferase